MCRFSVSVVTVILVLSFPLALFAAGPPVDQDKLLYLPPYVLYFQDVDSDSLHDAGEPCSPLGPPLFPDVRPDLSCWMASASNLLVHSGCPNPYVPWLCTGGAVSPNTSVWGRTFWADGGDAASDSMTFDDGGWQDWALTFAGAALDGPIWTIPEFFGGNWDSGGAWVNPITWCRTRLMANVPVGLTCWWGYVPEEEELPPGPIDHDLQWGYHAITLWNITGGPTGTMVITDSDDFGIMGVPLGTPRTVLYTFTPYGPGGVWTILNLYPGVSATVNYAVAITWEGPSATEETSWGGVKAMFR